MTFPPEIVITEHGLAATVTKRIYRGQTTFEISMQKAPPLTLADVQEISNLIQKAINGS